MCAGGVGGLSGVSGVPGPVRRVLRGVLRGFSEGSGEDSAVMAYENTDSKNLLQPFEGNPHPLPYN